MRKLVEITKKSILSSVHSCDKTQIHVGFSFTIMICIICFFIPEKFILPKIFFMILISIAFTTSISSFIYWFCYNSKIEKFQIIRILIIQIICFVILKINFSIFSSLIVTPMHGLAFVFIFIISIFTTVLYLDYKHNNITNLNIEYYLIIGVLISLGYFLPFILFTQLNVVVETSRTIILNNAEKYVFNAILFSSLFFLVFYLFVVTKIVFTKSYKPGETYMSNVTSKIFYKRKSDIFIYTRTDFVRQFHYTVALFASISISIKAISIAIELENEPLLLFDYHFLILWNDTIIQLFVFAFILTFSIKIYRWYIQK